VSSVASKRIPLDAPLPGLDLPDVPAVVDSRHAERQAYVASTSLYWKSLRRFRRQLEEYHRATQPPFDTREIIVRFVVGQDRVGAVVDWRDGRVGRAGLLHRASGPLRVNARTLRGVGPGVALHVLLRELERVTADL
jgi:hypothetical protein